MNDTIIIFLLILIIVVWYWWDTNLAKEIARREGKKACDDVDLQFLDDTVAKQKMWLARNNKGHMVICRCYHFEFANLGDIRYRGEITLFGNRVVNIKMDAYKI